MTERIIIENGKGLICELEGCELPAVRKVRVATGDKLIARTDDKHGKIIRTSEITYSEHWYCAWHAKLIESGH